MNLADYRNNARSLQALVIAVPLLSKLLEHNSDIPFPPMGDETLLFRLFAMLMVGVSVALPYAIPVKRAKHWVAIGLFFALMGATATYLRWEQNYVVTITFPAS